MARKVEEIKRVTRNVGNTDKDKNKVEETSTYEEEYYDSDDLVPEESSLNTASGVLALALLALAIYLVWIVLR